METQKHYVCCSKRTTLKYKQSFLLSGQNVCWPYHMLPPGDSR